MEHLFTVKRKPLKYEPPYFDRVTDSEIVRPLCRISNLNVIAFSSPTELTDSDGETWGGHVYVCDLATPWDAHKVTSTNNPVSSLEWDMEGNNLLVATTVGDVSVWGMKDHLLNQWTMKYSASYPGEHIIQSIFFHNGRRVIALDKKLEAPITERVQITRSTPTLKGFGGVSTEGALVVTSSLWAGRAGGAGGGAALSRCRAPATRAAMAHSNGAILVAWVPRSAARVRCCRVTVAPASLSVTPLPGLSLPEPASTITWNQYLEPESLLIANSTLSIWKLAERSYPIHKLLSKGPVQGSTTPGSGQKANADCFNTLSWQLVSSRTYEGGARRSASSSLSAAAAVASHTQLHLVTDRQIYSCPMPAQDSEAGGASSPKKIKFGNNSTSCILSDVSVSTHGGLALAIDTRASLHAFRLVHDASPLSMQVTSNLLDLSLVAGSDPLDILLTLKPDVVEPMYERVTEWFQRQPAVFQQYYYQQWLTLRTSICSLVGTWSAGSGRLSALQLCRAAAAAALLAARLDDPAPAPAPAPATSAGSTGPPAPGTPAKMSPPDVDKAIATLEAKSEACWSLTGGGLGGGVRLALQRVADTVASVLRSVHLPTTGYDLSTDPQAILIFRKVGALARRDIPLRTLAKLAHRTHSQDLVEECLSVSGGGAGGVYLREEYSRCRLALLPNGPVSYTLEYGVEPESLRFTPEPVPFDNVIGPEMDSIRYTYLGSAGVLRNCGRCGARSLPAPATIPADFHHRYQDKCRCGGLWTLVTNFQ